VLCRLTEARTSGLYAIITPPPASKLRARLRDFQNLRFKPTWDRRDVANVA
jgi:hypothetical protein